MILRKLDIYRNGLFNFDVIEFHYDPTNLPVAISEQQSSSGGIITDAGGSQILYSNFVAYCGSMLNVSCLLSKYTKDGEECQFQCLDTPECLSVNIESAFKGDGELQLCQLLASTNERKSELLVASERFHHYTMKVSKYLFPQMPLIC